MGWVSVNFVLLTGGASFDIVLDKGSHSWPIDFAFGKSICFLFSRVSGGRVVVVSLDYSAP
jgi:hypothetical protein